VQELPSLLDRIDAVMPVFDGRPALELVDRLLPAPS